MLFQAAIVADHLEFYRWVTGEKKIRDIPHARIFPLPLFAKDHTFSCLLLAALLPSADTFGQTLRGSWVSLREAHAA